MPIDLYSSLKGASQWAFGSQLLNNILGSSIFVAIIVSLLMILLIMFMYPAKSGTSFVVVAKMFIYMCFGSLLIIFLHDGVLKYMMEEQFTTRDSEHFMQNTTMQGRISDPSYSDLYKPISPQPQQMQQSPVQPSPVQQIPVQPLFRTETDTITGGSGNLRDIKVNKNRYKNPYQ